MTTDPKQQTASAIVVGAGPAGLIAAEALATAGLNVTVCDRMSSPGRKFLIAGRGGLNITHNLIVEAMLPKYHEAAQHLRPFIEAYPPDAIGEFCVEHDEEAFAGSSGRVFPKSFKSTPLLRSWLRRLEQLGVQFQLRCEFTGWDESGSVNFRTGDGDLLAVDPDVTILAMGGASWPRLGSDGSWTVPLKSHGVEVKDLKPSNCGFDVEWSDHIREKHAGAAIKNVQLSFAGSHSPGDFVITKFGVEGGAVYGLSAEIREGILASGTAALRIDLKPGLNRRRLIERLSKPRGKNSLSNHLRKTTGLTPPAIALLHESGTLPKEPEALAAHIKAVPLILTATRPIEGAISTAGGVSFEAVDERLMLRNMPGVFTAGEMLDWEAPTGGFLLQACFSTGVGAANGALEWLASRKTTAASPVDESCGE